MHACMLSAKNEIQISNDDDDGDGGGDRRRYL